jgi:hypothetical protein
MDKQDPVTSTKPAPDEGQYDWVELGSCSEETKGGYGGYYYDTFGYWG